MVVEVVVVVLHGGRTQVMSWDWLGFDQWHSKIEVPVTIVVSHHWLVHITHLLHGLLHILFDHVSAAIERKPESPML